MAEADPLAVALMEPVLDAMYEVPPRLYEPARATLGAMVEFMSSEQMTAAIARRDQLLAEWDEG